MNIVILIVGICIFAGCGRQETLVVTESKLINQLNISPLYQRISSKFGPGTLEKYGTTVTEIVDDYNVELVFSENSKTKYYDYENTKGDELLKQPINIVYIVEDGFSQLLWSTTMTRFENNKQIRNYADSQGIMKLIDVIAKNERITLGDFIQSNSACQIGTTRFMQIYPDGEDNRWFFRIDYDYNITKNEMLSVDGSKARTCLKCKNVTSGQVSRIIWSEENL